MGVGDTNIWDGSAADNAWDTAANWSLGTAPVTGELVIIPADATENIDGFNATAALLQGFTIERGCTINIGSRTASAITTLDLTMNYDTTKRDAQIAGTGTLYLNIDKAANVRVIQAGSSKGAGQWDCNIIGEENEKLYVTAAENEKISVGGNAGEACEFDEIHVLSAATVEIGDSVTEPDANAVIEKLIVDGGNVRCQSAVAAIEKEAGTLIFWGAGAVTTLNEKTGITIYDSTGTIATANVSGELDCGNNSGATITQLNLHAGSTYRDPNKAITNTNGIDLVKCGAEEVTLDIGSDMTLTRSAI